MSGATETPGADGPREIRPICGRFAAAVVAEARDSVVLAGDPRSRFRRAVVMAVADSYRGDVNVGDTVLLRPYAGQEVLWGGSPLVFARDADVVVVLVP